MLEDIHDNKVTEDQESPQQQPSQVVIFEPAKAV